MLSFKAPEDGPDISREHSLKDGVFIMMSIESDNNSSHLLASPSEVFVFDLLYLTVTPDFKGPLWTLPDLGRGDILGEE